MDRIDTRSLWIALSLTVAPSSLALDCAALQHLALPDIRIESAKASKGEDAPKENLPAGVTSTSARATVPHCKVDGVIGTEIRFEVLLPDDWNGKFLMGGGGGFVGALGYQGRFSVNRGYATAATDTGHEGSGTQADWALHHPERQANYGYAAVHRTSEAAKAIVRSYYGKAAARSYFYGCSNGGRQAMMSAQRYPEDFDGIIAGAPAHHMSGILAAFAYNMQRIYPDPSDLSAPVITPQNRQLLESSILARCDAEDGVEDGFLNDPRDCGFELTDLPLCSGPEGADDCLTVRQREAIAAVYDGPRNSQGQIFPGLPFGGESGENAWQSWVTGPNPDLFRNSGAPSLHFAFGTQGLKYFITRDPDADYSTYDFDRYDEDSAHMDRVLNAIDPDLSGFKKAGGKLLLWHGWSDAALTALASIDYFEEVENRDAEVRDYLRLFLMPGVFHCARGPGPDRVDWLGALEDWVERDEAPTSLTARKVKEGAVAQSRPLCVYPERAVYQGGDTNTADSFVCRAP